MRQRRVQQARESKKPVAWRSSQIVAFLERLPHLNPGLSHSDRFDSDRCDVRRLCNHTD